MDKPKCNILKTSQLSVQLYDRLYSYTIPPISRHHKKGTLKLKKSLCFVKKVSSTFNLLVHLLKYLGVSCVAVRAREAGFCNCQDLFLHHFVAVLFPLPEVWICFEANGTKNHCDSYLGKLVQVS